MAEDFSETRADPRPVETIGHQARNRLFIAIALIIAAVLALIWMTRSSPPATPVTAPSATGTAQTPAQDLSAPMPPPAAPPSEMAASNDLPPPPTASVPVPATSKPPAAVDAHANIDAPAPAASTEPLPRETIAPTPAASPNNPQTTATATPRAEAAPETRKSSAPMVTHSPVKAGTNGYVLQLGVFTNYQNAKQLQERLTQAGVQSYTETRVHVGPFVDKAEADQAREKLKALGITGVIVPAH